MSCYIKYTSDNQIAGMFAENGASSTLYPAMLERVRDVKKAVDLTTLTHTGKFVDVVITPIISKYKAAVKRQLDTLQPKNPSLQLLHKGQEYPVDVKNLEYKLVETKGFTTLQAFAKAGDEKVMLGKVRMKAFKEGMAIESTNLTTAEVYVNGNIESLKGKGIGTEMYKYAINHTLRQGKPFYSDANQTASATGVWNKLKATKIVKQEDGRNKIEAFPSSHFDKNKEVLPTVLINYVKAEQTKNKKLSFDQKQDIKNALLTLPYADSQEMSEALQKAFYDKNGEFTVVESKLKGIYNGYEIANIISDRELQKEIKSTLEALKNNDDLITNNTYYSDDFLSKETRMNSLGKMVNNNPLAIEQAVIQELGGINNENEFADKVENLEIPNLVTEGLYTSMQEFKRIPEMKIEGDALTAVNSNDVKVQLEQTFAIVEDQSISNDIIYLNELSQDLYDANIEDVKDLIKEIEKKAAKQGVDIIGLSDKVFAKNRDEIYDLLESLNTLITIPSDSSFNEFINQHQLVFETEIIASVKVQKTTTDNLNKSLVYLDTKVSEYDLFDKFNLIKVSKGVYQRVKKEELPALYQKLYGISQYNEGILPIEAYPFANEGGILNLSTLRNAENRDIITADMQRFVENEVSKLDLPNISTDNTVLQQMVINKYAFNHPVSSKETVNIQEEFNNFTAFDGSEAYLKTDFIADFYVDYLAEKIKDSNKFKNFYSNFGVNEKGITLLKDDLITIETIKDYLKDSNIKRAKDLANYSLLTEQIPNLKEVAEPDTYFNRDFLRAFYSNNPQALDKLQQDYKILSPTAILVKNNVAGFVRVKNGVYELLETRDNNSFYEMIPVNNSEYKTFDVAEPISSIDNSDYGAEEVNPENFIKSEKYYNKTQEEEINNKNFDCL